MSNEFKEHVVIIGHGMVGQRLVEKLTKEGVHRITVVGEEPRRAYDRVRLTSFFDKYSADHLYLKEESWYSDSQICMVVNDPVVKVDRTSKSVLTKSGTSIEYDQLVFATGAYAWKPPIEGADNKGVFVYRTIDDLTDMIAYKDLLKVKSAAVIGGGLLGLEAAKVCLDMGLSCSVIDHNQYFMGRQLDSTGGRILTEEIKALGASCCLGARTNCIAADSAGHVVGIHLTSKDHSFVIDCQLVIIATGIRPRDDLGRECDLDISSGGGIIVDDKLATSDPFVYAIGECASHRSMYYGIVAPGYEMAAVLANNLCTQGSSREFLKGDMNTKLKLMGVDVASFGDYQPGQETEAMSERAVEDRTTIALQFHDPFKGIYRKLIFTTNGKRLVGGMLVGDASDYAQLVMMCNSNKDLKQQPQELIVPPSLQTSTGGGDVGDIEDSAQICSCNDVSKGDLVQAFREKGCNTMEKLANCTGAGSSCGGCKPVVKGILNAELANSGVAVTNYLCDHFSFSRAELYHIVQVKKIKSFEDLIKDSGNPECGIVGCGDCKTTVGSILASLWNEPILGKDRAKLQDTNDKYLANIQRGGSYSVVPRIAGGEVTPDGLIAIGQVGKKYGLYTKITGGQRVDLFGADVSDLPAIWKELVDAGFESGHAYGKSLRTVKSCVGSTWCRYGMLDSVGMAIKLENRYKGIRSPHKLKGGVSGCIRECAEAQSKDFGLIATEGGWNIYVCGNGGTKPRHATLLASAVSEKMTIRIIDRFLIFYISTADRLQRTARWLEAMDGGIEYLKDVILNDKLKINAELEKQMDFLVDTYHCEWKDAINDPEKLKMFKQFVNTNETDQLIEFVDQRGQRRPADWPKDPKALPKLDMQLENEESECKISYESASSESATSSGSDNDDIHSMMRAAQWTRLIAADDVPEMGGVAVKYGKSQIAIFNFSVSGKFYASQNMEPAKNSFVLSRGILELKKQSDPTVLEPFHKRAYSLITGKCTDGSSLRIRMFPVRFKDGNILVKLPSEQALAKILDTSALRIKAPKSEDVTNW